LKVENVDLNEERKLVTIIIMFDIACTKLLPLIDKHSTKTLYANLICTWVNEYFQQYKTAPKNVIQELFEQKKKSIRDEETASSVAAFLTSLADSFDENTYANIDYFVTNAETYVRSNQVDALMEQVEKAKASGNVTKCESLIAGFKKKAIPETQGISLLNNVNSFREAFDEEHLESLFEFPGALGKVVGSFFRGDLSSVLSTSKAGKSFEAMGVSFSALAYSRKVLVINLEMRDVELRQRYWRGLVNAPMVSGPVSVPFFRPDKEMTEDLNDDRVMWRVDHKILNMQGVAFDNTDKIMDIAHMRYKGGDIKLMSLPSYTTSWSDIESILDNLEYYDSWIPDLLVVDYFDLMASKETEFRHKINDIWSFGRKVALSRGIHIHTVSQSNASGNNGAEISLDSISEDQRKKSHVSLLYGMWATDADREAGIVRVKRLVGRGKPETYDGAVILQSLDTGQFLVDSRLSSKVEG
jgi:hypothetical protein